MVKKMGEHPSLKGKPLPSPVQVWRYWRSLGDRLLPRRRPAQPKRAPAGVAHGVWQMDAKGLSAQDITRLPGALDDLPVRQLMLPLSMCYPQPVSQGGMTL